MDDEIRETDEKMNKLIKMNKGSTYKGTNYIESEQNQFKGIDKNDPDGKKDDDIFNSYGFGITSWFNLLQKLMMVYALLSVFAIGIMMTYAGGSELTSS